MIGIDCQPDNSPPTCEAWTPSRIQNITKILYELQTTWHHKFGITRSGKIWI